MKFKIADLIVEMQPVGPLIERAKKYTVDCSKADCNQKVDLVVVPGDIEKYNSKERLYSFEEFQYMSFGSDFYRKLIDFNGMMLHASCVAVDGKAYLFSATSGTGKSTHTGLWLKMLGDKAVIINDDKPAIRKIDGKFYACGTPWSGKSDINENMKCEIQGICFIERDVNNWIERLSPEIAITRLIHATLKKLPIDRVDKQLSLINDLIFNVPIYKMGCTPTLSAAEMSYNYMKDAKHN